MPDPKIPKAQADATDVAPAKRKDVQVNPMSKETSKLGLNLKGEYYKGYDEEGKVIEGNIDQYVSYPKAKLHPERGHVVVPHSKVSGSQSK